MCPDSEGAKFTQQCRATIVGCYAWDDNCLESPPIDTYYQIGLILCFDLSYHMIGILFRWDYMQDVEQKAQCVLVGCQKRISLFNTIHISSIGFISGELPGHFSVVIP